jgi:hypothetical protein
VVQPADDVSVCLCRTAWLTAGRILRAVSVLSGDTELYGLWRAWTLPGAAREACPAVWASLRPPSNCDEPAIAKARDYIHRNISHFTAAGRAPPDPAAASQDIMIKSIIADADQILRHAMFEYWSDSEELAMGERKPKKRLAFGGRALRKQITSPAAIYSYDAEVLVHDVLAEQRRAAEGEGAAAPAPAKPRTIGQFEELRDVQACVAPGSVIGVKESGSHAWYLVHSVDVLFARLRVSPCLPPPFPWLGDGSSPTQDSALCWLPVSKMWSALVCSRVDSYMGLDRCSTN